MEDPKLEKEISLEKELSALLSKYSVENESDTPDFILAAYLLSCLDTYNLTVKARDKWFDFDPWKEIKGNLK